MSSILCACGHVLDRHGPTAGCMVVGAGTSIPCPCHRFIAAGARCRCGHSASDHLLRGYVPHCCTVHGCRCNLFYLADAWRGQTDAEFFGGGTPGPLPS